MNPDITLVNAGDRPNLQLLRHVLNQTPNIDVTYVNINHVCPTPNHIYLRQEHIRLVVYSNLYYQDILAIVIDDNARISPEDFDENVLLDTTPTNIGYCICNQQTQTL